VLSGLDEYCQQAIADWQVPGIAVAVIRDGKLSLARGYGVRELGKDASVDENTIFDIASCTKSFTAAMVGKLVDQNKLRWDDTLIKHVPFLVIPTQGRDAEVTIRHALQHRTGLPTANMLWRSGELDAEEILRRVRFLKPVAAPGDRLIYNNVMYLAAGKAAEHASGKSWSDFVTEEFFEPLGMKSSLADSSTLKSFGNVAEPHATIDGQVKAIERSNDDVIAPAGAIYSSAADMARWLIMHLDRGRFGGHELLTAGRVDEMHTPVEPPPAKPSTKGVPKAPISRYGMGWFVNEHAGEKVVEHAGSGIGFVSWMAIMPKERLGVVILSNHKGTGINYALRFWIFDRLLGRPDFDWSSSVRKDYTEGGQRLLREAQARFDAKRPPEKPPSRPLADYAGSYESRLYGMLQVTEKDGHLKLTFGTRFQGEFKAWQGDAFRVFFSNPLHHDWLVTFSVADGKVASLRAQEAPWAPQWYDDRDDLGEFFRR
jgi:CubicO group peptidase (beta-lactamase class C family)